MDKTIKETAPLHFKKMVLSYAAERAVLEPFLVNP